MNAFYEHHKDHIRFTYRCFDRILLNGLIQPFQQPERVVGFFGTYIKVHGSVYGPACHRRSGAGKNRVRIRTHNFSVEPGEAPTMNLTIGRPTITDEVRHMYEQYPYPSPLAGNDLILDLANTIRFLAPRNNLKDRWVLDAGCGTGHRLVALAQAFPEARFTGADLTTSALTVAKSLAERHHVKNLDFIQCNIVEGLPDRYDVIVSTGVIHHLEDPEQGINQLYHALTEDGILILWLYHYYGEFYRLLDRQLARIFWHSLGTPQTGRQVELLRRLGLSLPAERYGTSTSQQEYETNQCSIDVDAYLHPMVKTFTFNDVIDMLARCGADWIAPNGMNAQHKSKLVDLGGTYKDPFFILTSADLFRDQEIQDAFDNLSPRQKIEVLELSFRPTGFTVISGRNDSYELLEPRVRGNIV